MKEQKFYNLKLTSNQEDVIQSEVSQGIVLQMPYLNHAD